MQNLWIEFGTVVARLGFKRRSTALLKSNLIRRSIYSIHSSSTTFETGLICTKPGPYTKDLHVILERRNKLKNIA